MRSVSSSRDSESDVHSRERRFERGGTRDEGLEEEKGLVDFGSHDGRSVEGDGGSVDLD